VTLAINLGPILLWGIFATGVLTLVLSLSQAFGWTRISIPYMIGSVFTEHRRPAMLGGILIHFVIGIVLALLYVALFESIGIANVWVGLIFGALHGLFVLVVLTPLVPAMHPRMAGKHHGPTPTRQLEPPGFFALNYGRRTPLITLSAHVVYGGVLGFFYELSTLTS
jgi:hypothetical protein